MALNGPWMNDNALDNRYQYNGKEIDEDFGLKVYHYGARIYDPAIGRFTGVDPISDKFPWVSTYNYAENEPVANIDLHGLQKVSIHFLGQLSTNESSSSAIGTATYDLGNKNNLSFSIAFDGIGAVSGSYSEKDGLKISPNANFDFKEVLYEIDTPRGVVIPKRLVKWGLNKAINSFTPKDIDEAISLSDEDSKFNEAMSFLLNSIKQMSDQDIFTGLYDYDGSEETATNSKGEEYERKFTSVYKAKFKGITFAEDGIRFQGKLVLSGFVA